MCTDRQAAISSLLEKVREVYCDTLLPGEYGSPDAHEIILGVVLSTQLETGVTSTEEIEKALQSLPPHSEYLEG